jgi:DNA-binding CsgD family transcriptional regulator
MARRENSGAFTQQDADTLALAAPAIAHGIRASLRFDAARRAEGPEAPGLIVLDAENNVELITPPAFELLDAIRSDAVTESGETPPNALLGLASFARRNGSRADPGANVITVPSARGWIRLHASLIAGSAAGKVAIFIEPASGPHSATLRLEVHGVSAREREVATLLARGLTNAEIAAALVLSPHTVQDHIKSLYEKIGVTSRQELVARAFLDEYLPHVVERTPITSRGRFERALPKLPAAEITRAGEARIECRCDVD